MIKKYSKRFENLKKEISNKNFYTLDEGINLVKKISTAKFIETIEAHISLNIDPKNGNQQLRTNVDLPHGTGKNTRVAVLTDVDKISQALNDGADVAGADDLIEDISKGIINFDVLLTSRQFMPKLTPLGKILGPKGLMPSPKFGTVTDNFKLSIQEFKKGKVEYRADKTGIVHLGIGKASFSEKQLKENLLAIYISIEKNKPQGVKGRYFNSFTICSTMSPGIAIDLQSVKN
jgi:large subunit ribosomal protein L1